MRRNVPIFLAAEFARGLAFVYAVAVLFYQEIGISYTGLSVMWLAMAVVQAVLEIPFGVLSDRVGHRATVLSGYATLACAILLIGSGTSIWLPLVGSAIWGVSGALLSGSADAFLYDSLKSEGREHDYLKIRGRSGVALSLGIVVGAIPGAYLYGLNMRYPWYAQAACIALAFCIFLFSRRTPAPDRAGSAAGHWRHLRASLVYIARHKPLVWLTLATTLSLFPLYGLSMIRQPYLVARSVPVEHLGYIFAGIQVLTSLVGLVAHRIETALGLARSFFVAIVLLIALFVLGARAPGYWAIAPLALLYGCFRFKDIVLNAHSNHRIPSEQRATILSVQAMGGSCLLIAFMLTSGIILDALPLDFYVFLMAAYLAVAVLPLWLVRRRFGIASKGSVA